MPVKVRCSGCQKVLNAPDKARGKVLKCPQCGTKIKVPGGGSASKPKPRPKPAGDDDFLSGLRVEQLEAEATDEKVCPYCAADMDPEEIVCTNCGRNIETGQMDRKEARKRSRKGPDPALFYSKAWSDSWEFLCKHWRLAVRTGLVWTTFMVLATSSNYMAAIWVVRPGSLAGEEEVAAAPMPVDGEGEEAEDPNAIPVPILLFWLGMGFVFSLGVPGWYWALSLKIVDATMNREEIKEDRIQLDMFSTIALGFRALFWPYVMMAPALPIIVLVGLLMTAGVGAIASFDSNAATAVAGGGFLLTYLIVWAIPFLVFPQTMVHMTMPYRHKAWILWEQLKILVNNFGATLYWWLVAIAVMLPVIIIAVLLAIFGTALTLWWMEQMASMVDWVMEFLGGSMGSRGIFFRLVLSLLVFILMIPVCAPLAFLTAFPAVFLMRANGLYGFYRRETLNLDTHMSPGTIASFWVRFLCRVIDDAVFLVVHGVMFAAPTYLFLSGFPMGKYFGGMLLPFINLAFVAIAGAHSKKASMASLGMGALTGVFFIFGETVPFFAMMYMLMSFLLPVYNYGLYYISNETSTQKSTIGKEAFGVVVETEKGQQLTVGAGFARHIGRIVCNFLLSLPYLVAAFHPKKQAPHDLMAKSVVVFRGDR